MYAVLHLFLQTCLDEKHLEISYSYEFLKGWCSEGEGSFSPSLFQIRQLDESDPWELEEFSCLFSFTGFLNLLFFMQYQPEYVEIH